MTNSEAALKIDVLSFLGFLKVFFFFLCVVLPVLEPSLFTRLALKLRDQPASASPVVGSKACATMPHFGYTSFIPPF